MPTCIKAEKPTRIFHSVFAGWFAWSTVKQCIHTSLVTTMVVVACCYVCLADEIEVVVGRDGDRINFEFKIIHFIPCLQVAFNCIKTCLRLQESFNYFINIIKILNFNNNH